MKLGLRHCLLALVVSASCLSATQGPTQQGSLTRSKTRLIASHEIRSVDRLTAYDLVASLRPMWLRNRDVQSQTLDRNVVVYFNNMRLGGKDALQSIDARSVASLEYFNATEAALKWGPGHEYGVIQVRTR
jgi:hypothetical protein